MPVNLILDEFNNIGRIGGAADASKLDNISELPQYSRYMKPNTLKQRVERSTCELCGKACKNLEIHQVKKLKDLKGSAPWVIIMRKRRRKTLVVCPDCYARIHSV